MDQTGSFPVKLYIYDLSRGMARQLSPVMLGEYLTSYLFVAFMRPVVSTPGTATETRRERG